MKHIFLRLTVLGPMSAISETYNRAHNNLELVYILPNVFFTTSGTEGVYC